MTSAILLLAGVSILADPPASRALAERDLRPEAWALGPAVSPLPEPRVIEVTARSFAFEPSEIEVTEGDRVRLVVRSADGPHGLEITQFRVSKDIPRGKDPVIIEFTADTVGRFPILCSVYCGEGHDDMKGALVVTAHASAQP